MYESLILFTLSLDNGGCCGNSTYNTNEEK
jgi:hypothetical protein